MTNAGMAPLFKALGDVSRLKMIALLANKKFTVDELRKKLRISHSSASQHLKLLYDAGLVRFARHGNFRIYSLQRNRIAKAMRYFDNLWDEDLARLKLNLEKHG